MSALLPSLALTALLAAPPSANLVLVNGRIYTVDDARPRVSALAVKGGRIAFAGSDAEARVAGGPGARVIDLQGKTVLPGFIDAHAHLLGLGNFLRRANLTFATSYDEVIARVVVFGKQAKPGEWIQGRGWDQNLWPEKQFPTHEALSRAFPDNPVVLTRVDGHALLANQKAMELAHVDASTPDPEGGRILRLPSGAPSGVFVDNAQRLILRALPALSREHTRDAVLAAIRECNRWGLTGIDDAGEDPATISVYEELARAGKYNLRNYVMLSDPGDRAQAALAKGPRSALYDGRLWIRAVKLYADGALGSRGAALLQPYADDPGNTGLLVSSPEHIRAIAELALRRGFQVAVHAIGDRANRLVLDQYDAALRAVPVADHRFRIEHAQVLSPEDIPRFARLGVVPSMQATHQTSDMRWAEQRLGPERIRGAYAWRSLLDTGVVIPNGTDFPVEQVNPLLTFHAAVTRQDPRGAPEGGWYPAQRMSREEALRSMTIWAAWAGFQESVMGSLAPGKYADFIVLDRDILTAPESEILDARVLATYLGGREVYDAGRRH
jgi:predicted amidohydrolase YtcJ